MILGITGGMGCGKSTAAKLFERHGFRRLDSDRVVRDEVLTDPLIRERLQERFGAGVLGADGAVDRPHLGQLVFTDDSALSWLEELTHRPLFAIWRREFRKSPEALWAVEVPLLFEKNLENWFDFTVCVACAPAQQLARLEQRGLPHALAEQRISKQLPLARKIELADFVLWNEGTPEFLESEIVQLIETQRVAR